MIKVLHLITGLDVGGAEAMLTRLVLSMDQSSFENVVVSMRDEGAYGEELAGQGVRVCTLRMKKRISDVGALMRLATILQRENPHVLQCWMYHANCLGTFVSAFKYRLRLLWSLRCSDMSLARPGRVATPVVRIGRYLARLPRAVVVNSQAGCAYHQAIGYRARRWVVIENGFDLDQFVPRREIGAHLRDQWSPGGEHLIGFVGRLDPIKDHGSCLVAAAHLARKRSDVRFVIIGDGPGDVLVRLRAQAAALGLERRLVWAGERKDMPAVYNAIDVVCSSSLSEGFPNVIGEAMSCGVPCAATDVGDARILLGDGGVLVPPADPAALSQALERVLTQSPEEWTQMSLRARRRIEECYSLKSVVSRYEQLYEEVVRL